MCKLKVNHFEFKERNCRRMRSRLIQDRDHSADILAHMCVCARARESFWHREHNFCAPGVPPRLFVSLSVWRLLALHTCQWWWWWSKITMQSRTASAAGYGVYGENINIYLRSAGGQICSRSSQETEFGNVWVFVSALTAGGGWVANWMQFARVLFCSACSCAACSLRVRVLYLGVCVWDPICCPESIPDDKAKHAQRNIRWLYATQNSTTFLTFKFKIYIII